MTNHQNESHSQQIIDWDKSLPQGLDLEALLGLYGKAFAAIENRSRVTLSNLTFQVVCDRVLSICIEKFPLLSAVEIKVEGLQLSGVMPQLMKHNVTSVRVALRELLIELLTVLSNITANILRQPLLDSVLAVKYQGEPLLKNQSVVQLAKTNRESK